MKRTAENGHGTGGPRCRIAVFEDAVFEDEVDIGRRWLQKFRIAEWALPEEDVFTDLAAVVVWIEERRRGKEPWVIITDIDVTTSGIPGDLQSLQRDIEASHPRIAGYPGVVLLAFLQRENLLQHVAAVTGVNFGPLHEWFRNLGVASRLKPVWSSEILELVRTLSRSQAGGGAS